MFVRAATKLAIVSGATILVVNHEVFGANKYTQQIINKVRTSLPDTAEAFDQMPTRVEMNHAVVDTWNSGRHRNLSMKSVRTSFSVGVQTSFKWLLDAPAHTRRLFSSLADKIKG